MSITIANKGIDKRTGLPLSYKRGQITWDEEALCFFVMIQPFITYPSGVTENLPAIRQILQDIPACDAIYYPVGTVISRAVYDNDGVTITTPAVIADGSQIQTPAVVANPVYTNFVAAFNTAAIGNEIDAYIAGLTVQ